MRVYKIPFDIKHEEKIFGGYLSLRQVIYLLFAVLSAGVFFLPILKAIKILIFSILATIFVSFAFVKIDETRLDKYFIYFLKYIFRNKKYNFER